MVRKISSRRILVTGGTGFIGSHLVEKLLQKGARVCVPYKELLPNSYFVKNGFKKHVSLAKVDIRNRNKITQFIKNEKTDFIFHLGAQTVVTKALLNPIETLESNIVGTFNILEAVRNSKKVEGIIVASSDKAYGKTTKKYTENSPLRGDHPYDVSKSSADLISTMYYKTYKTPVIITRFGNIYGEGDLHMDRIIPGICEAVIQNKTLAIRSNGEYVRDYVYVKDVVEGYMLLFEKFKKHNGEAFNFSSKETLSVVELIKKIERVLKISVKFDIQNTAVNEIPYQHLDDRKIRKLGWRNEYSLAKTINTILAWYSLVVKK